MAKKPEIVHVTLPRPTQAYGQIPDAHACAMAFPYALREGIAVIEVQNEGEVHTRRYTIEQVATLLQTFPMLQALGGIGHPEPTPGVVQAGGRHIFLGRETKH